MSDITDFRKAEFNESALKEYKDAYLQFFIAKAKHSYITEMSKGTQFCDPWCDANGNWIQKASPPSFPISDNLINECKQTMQKYCTNNKGKSAVSVLNELYNKQAKFLEVTQKLEKEAVETFAAKKFNKSQS